MTVLSLEESLEYHLKYGMTVSFPPVYVEMCKQAIEAMNEGDVYRRIKLANGAHFRDFVTGEVMDTAQACFIAKRLHLDNFLVPNVTEKYLEFEKRKKEQKNG